MEWWQAVILGLVEGITEYLPVSSTGHLILTSELLGLNDGGETQSAVYDFNIIIQGGAILAVLGLYWPRIVQMLKGLVGRDAAGRRLLINLVVAFMPAAVLGVLFDDMIEGYLAGTLPILIALVVGGIYMMAVDRVRIAPLRKKEAETGEPAGLEIDDLTPVKALIIGFLQCIAMLPGTSRSMMTITGGVLVGLRPKAAAEFSFLLGLPTLGGACVLKLFKNLKHAHDTGAPNLFEQLGWLNVAIGIAVATVSAAIAVRWLVGFLNKHGLMAFGWYRIGLAIVLAVVFYAGVAS